LVLIILGLGLGFELCGLVNITEYCRREKPLFGHIVHIDVATNTVHGTGMNSICHLAENSLPRLVAASKNAATS